MVAITPFHREEGEDTPKVYFDPQQGYYEIQGASFPDDAGEFYIPILEWVDNLVANYDFEHFPKELFVKMHFYYFNSGTAKYVYEIFQRLKKLVDQGAKLKVQWYYPKDDIDDYHAGKEYERLLGVPFEFIEDEEPEEEWDRLFEEGEI